MSYDDAYLREQFEMIDTDGSGELEEDEMRALFENMGKPVSKRIIANLMRLSDTDGNGTSETPLRDIVDSLFRLLIVVCPSILVDFGEFKGKSAVDYGANYCLLLIPNMHLLHAAIFDKVGCANEED